MNGIKLKKVSSATLWVWGVMVGIVVIAGTFVFDSLPLRKEDLTVLFAGTLIVALTAFGFRYQVALHDDYYNDRIARVALYVVMVVFTFTILWLIIVASPENVRKIMLFATILSFVASVAFGLGYQMSLDIKRYKEGKKTVYGLIIAIILWILLACAVAFVVLMIMYMMSIPFALENM